MSDEGPREWRISSYARRIIVKDGKRYGELSLIELTNLLQYKPERVVIIHKKAYVSYEQNS